MKNQKTMGNKGFSLVELIVVIAIMAVLVGVLAPQFIKYVEKSKESTDIQNISSVGSALQTYFVDHTPKAGTTSVTVTLGVETTDEDAVKALSNAGFGDTVKLKGTWTAAPSVTYTIGSTSVTYAGESDYYKANSDGSGYDAQ